MPIRAPKAVHRGDRDITITTEEATERMRAAGMKISPTVVRNGIKQGVFPLGDAIESETPGTFRFFVYPKLLTEWLEEKGLGQAQDSA